MGVNVFISVIGLPFPCAAIEWWPIVKVMRPPLKIFISSMYARGRGGHSGKPLMMSIFESEVLLFISDGSQVNSKLLSKSNLH